ncbi:MAG: hypothetical protein ACI82Z_000481 [Cellvibrionaceae bacterium]|jgi:hypothetical protein
MTTSKKIGVSVAVLAVVIAVAIAAFFLISNNRITDEELKQIVRESIETVGSEITGTAVSLRTIDSNISEGSGVITALEVANPDGFNSDYLLKWDIVSFQFDPESLDEDVILIKELVIGGINVNFEVDLVDKDKLTQNLISNLEFVTNPTDGFDFGQYFTQKNIDGVLENLAARKGSVANAAGVRLAVERILFSEGSVNLIVAQGASYPLELSSFESDAANRSAGLTPQALGITIVETLLKRVKSDDGVENYLKNIVIRNLGGSNNGGAATEPGSNFGKVLGKALEGFIADKILGNRGVEPMEGEEEPGQERPIEQEQEQETEQQ